MPQPIAPVTLGVSLHQPDAQLGVAFADGRPPVILHRPDLLARTAASLAAYSRTDAATYEELKRRSEAFAPLIRDGLYAPPNLDWFAKQAEAVRQAFGTRCDARMLGRQSARGLIDALFEAAEVRLLLYHLATETGLALEDEGGAIAFLGYSLWIAGRWRTVQGGMSAYTGALEAAATAAGAKLFCGRRAARILAKDGRVIGVRTSAGETIAASKAVLGAAPILDIEAMLDADLMAEGELAELDAFRKQQPGSIAGTAFCLDRAPNYKSARHDAEINACLKTVIGHATPSDAITQAADIRAGLLPKPAGVARVHSLWDAQLAPQGCHVAGVDSAFPATGALDAETWRLVEASFADALVEVWREHCDEGSLGVLAARCSASSAFERRMLVRIGPDQYRTSVRGLYLGGPGMYPGGGVHGACGRNAALTMLDDFKSALG